MITEMNCAQGIFIHYLERRCPRSEMITKEVLEDMLEDMMDMALECDLVEICRNLPIVVTRDCYIEVVLSAMLLYNTMDLL